MKAKRRRFTVTLYAGAQSSKPFDSEEFESFWDFCDALDEMLQETPGTKKNAPPAKQKEGMWAWAPHVVREGEARGVKSVDAVTLLVIDVDACELRPLFKAIREMEIDAYVYTSPSDDKAKLKARRVRVLTPIDRDIETNAECHLTRKLFAEALGLGEESGVGGALDNSRIFFIGRMHGSAPRESWRFEAGA